MKAELFKKNHTAKSQFPSTRRKIIINHLYYTDYTLKSKSAIQYAFLFIHSHFWMLNYTGHVFRKLVLKIHYIACRLAFKREFKTSHSVKNHYIKVNICFSLW